MRERVHLVVCSQQLKLRAARLSCCSFVIEIEKWRCPIAQEDLAASTGLQKAMAGGRAIQDPAAHAMIVSVAGAGAATSGTMSSGMASLRAGRITR